MMSIVLLCFLLGLSFGSFANVYFYRLPKDLSLFGPGSFCPVCKESISWYDNIPVVSFCLIRGRCRRCRAPISAQYPLVELASGLLFAWIGYKFSGHEHVVIAGFLFFTLLLELAAGIDLVTFWRSGKEYGIIPDHLVLLLAVGGLSFSPFNPFMRDWWQAPIAGAEGFAFMYFFRWAGEKMFGREALGFGDVKLVSTIGLWLGWQGVIVTVIAGSSLGAVLSIVLLRLHQMDRRSTVPFAPFLVAGSLCALAYL